MGCPSGGGTGPISDGGAGRRPGHVGIHSRSDNWGSSLQNYVNKYAQDPKQFQNIQVGKGKGSVKRRLPPGARPSPPVVATLHAPRIYLLSVPARSFFLPMPFLLI